MESMLYSRTQSTVKKKVRKGQYFNCFHYQPGPDRRYSSTRMKQILSSHVSDN